MKSLGQKGTAIPGLSILCILERICHCQTLGLNVDCPASPSIMFTLLNIPVVAIRKFLPVEHR
jgi:hypothetical protein